MKLFEVQLEFEGGEKRNYFVVASDAKGYSEAVECALRAAGEKVSPTPTTNWVKMAASGRANVEYPGYAFVDSNGLLVFGDEPDFPIDGAVATPGSHENWLFKVVLKHPLISPGQESIFFTWVHSGGGEDHRDAVLESLRVFGEHEPSLSVPEVVSVTRCPGDICQWDDVDNGCEVTTMKKDFNKCQPF